MTLNTKLEDAQIEHAEQYLQESIKIKRVADHIETLYKTRIKEITSRLDQSNSMLDYIETKYPAIFTEAYEVIVNHKPPPPDLSKVRLKTPEELEQEGL